MHIILSAIVGCLCFSLVEDLVRRAEATIAYTEGWLSPKGVKRLVVFPPLAATPLLQ